MPKYVIEREIPGLGMWSEDQLKTASQTSCGVSDGRRRRRLPGVEGDPRLAHRCVRRSGDGGDLRIRSRRYAGHGGGGRQRHLGAPDRPRAMARQDRENSGLRRVNSMRSFRSEAGAAGFARGCVALYAARLAPNASRALYASPFTLHSSRFQWRASPHCKVVNLVRSGRKQPQLFLASAGVQARHPIVSQVL